MIRKIIIVVLTLGAVGTGVLLAASYRLDSEPLMPAKWGTISPLADEAYWRWLSRYAARARGSDPLRLRTLFPPAKYAWGFCVRIELTNERRAFLAVSGGRLLAALAVPSDRRQAVGTFSKKTYGLFAVERWVTTSITRECGNVVRRMNKTNREMYLAQVRSGEAIIRHATMPLWAPLGLFAIYPTLAFIRGPVRRWRRRRRGLCAKCGYNLTGLTEPRCPECGLDVAVLSPQRSTQ